MNIASRNGPAASAARRAWLRARLIGGIAAALASTYAPRLLADEKPVSNTLSSVAVAATSAISPAEVADSKPEKKSVWTSAPSLPPPADTAQPIHRQPRAPIRP
jgi:hypothetical protein